jgi:enoyl-CoA hydratase/carnithine racemase
VDQLTTITVDRDDTGVATVTLNRPDRYNAFNPTMCEELSALWKAFRHDDDVRAVVLTGAGEKAFCTGVDRDGGVPATEEDLSYDPFTYDDPGEQLGPKSNDLWKPVIAAVNGMACGGAFYLLGEVEFIIAAEHATFFDPHVTYGMPAVYEPTLMASRMPFGEVMRMSLMGNHERITAAGAQRMGMVSEVVSGEELLDTALTAARAIASAPPIAVQTTLRTIWAAQELTRSQAVGLGNAFLTMGMSAEALAEGSAAFNSGRRMEPRLRD